MKIAIRKSSLLAICIVICILALDNFLGFGSPIALDNTYLLTGVIVL